MSRSNQPLSGKLFLLKELVIRDIRSRHAGSGLGIAWLLFHPILWMVLYTAVFSVVLRVPVETGFATFPEFLMAGLLPWMAIQEGLARSASVLTDNAAMVKKTVFPIESLVASVVLAAAFNQVVAFAVFGVYVAALGHLSIPWLALALPALALQLVLTYGLGCLAATVTVFVRDAAHAIHILLTVVFFLTPIVYPASLAPEPFRALLQANPVTHLVDWYRSAFTLHALPSPSSALYLTLVAVSAAALGTRIFARGKPHFADLI